LEAARTHAEKLGWTPADLKVISEAFTASSTQLKGSSIGLKTDAFMARLARQMESQGVSVIPKPERPGFIKIEVSDVNRYTKAIASVRDEARDEHRKLGFVPWDNRAMMACPDNELDPIMNAVRDNLARERLPFDFNWAARAMLDAFMMNPQVYVENGRFVCPPLIKPPFVETFTKALIGRVPGLRYEQKGFVARALCDGSLYSDGSPVDHTKVFPRLETYKTVLGDSPDNIWSPEAVFKEPKFQDRRRVVHEANCYLVERILHSALKLTPGQCRLLEVGPGWGDFYDLTPEPFRRDFEQLEWNPRLVDHFKKRFPEAKVRQGNAYEMAQIYPPNSFDAVFFFTASSSFYNLDHVLDQTWKILRPGGFLVSIHDLISNDQQVAIELIRRGMACSTRADLLHALWFRDPETRDKVMGEIPEPKFKGPIQEWRKVTRLIHENAAIENINEYFYKWLEIEAEYRGFKLISKTAPRHTVAVRGRKEGDNPSILQESGIPEGPLDFTLREYNSKPEENPQLTDFARKYGHSAVIESSLVWTFIAQKPG
jgi:SAM-dependent methyltransferase